MSQDRGVEQYVIRGGQPGYERLQVLARAWWPLTSVLFDRIGLGPGMRCLDLGCGSGDVTFEMARRVGPDSQVIGIDMDEVKLALAREAAAARGLDNVEFQAMSVYDWTEPDAYDFVYCRFLLQHLGRPVDVLRAMWAAVRPGGVIVAGDADFEGSFCYPPNEAFDFWVESFQRVLERRGGDPQMGRKLHTSFAQAGIPEPDLDVGQHVQLRGEAKTMPYLTIEATADAIVAEGVATAEQVRAALDELAAFAVDPTSICGSPRMVHAWSRRPR
jgi:ubiquinone/menaquinone biosynthesis C-methylase UbiE